MYPGMTDGNGGYRRDSILRSRDSGYIVEETRPEADAHHSFSSHEMPH